VAVHHGAEADAGFFADTQLAQIVNYGAGVQICIGAYLYVVGYEYSQRLQLDVGPDAGSKKYFIDPDP